MAAIGFGLPGDAFTSLMKQVGFTAKKENHINNLTRVMLI